MNIRICIKTHLLPGLMLLFISLSLSCNRHGDPSVRKYDRFLTRVYKKGHFNGNVLVIKNGEIDFILLIMEPYRVNDGMTVLINGCKL